MIKVGIIGGGACGILSAIELKRKLNDKVEIDIIEKNNRLGKKILASGNGRCNITNLSANPLKYNNVDLIFEEFENLIPYKLTIDQKKAIYDIQKDMSSKFAMNRLIQGDVGSGKTLVAMFAAYLAAKNGYQAAIIAPTEILAKQHYETAKKLFGAETVAYYSASVKGFDKHLALANIRFGKAKIIIGTHSIISDLVGIRHAPPQFAVAASY